MKTLKQLLSRVTIPAIAAMLILTSCGSQTRLVPGTAVCAKWMNGWYEATITSESGGAYNVTYGDGATGTVKAEDIKLPAKKGDLKIGDKVVAVWTSVKYYDGVVNEVKDDGCMVQWNDGSSPSFTSWGKIVKM